MPEPLTHSSPPQAHLDRQLLEAVFADITILASRFKQLANRSSDLAPVGRSILELLQQIGPQTVPQLARTRSTSRQNIQIIVNRLITDGCVQFRSNPGHRRSPFVCITELGLRRLSECPDPYSPLMDVVLAAIPSPDIEVSRRALARLRELIANDTKMQKAPSPKVSQVHKDAQHRSAIDKEIGNSDDLKSGGGDDNNLPVNLL